MNGNEGLMRIARVIAGLGWMWGIGLGIAALSSRPGMTIPFVIIGIAGFGVAKAFAWIIQGFASPRR